MNKKYLMNGFAALALVASVSSCTKDVTAMSQGEIDEKSKENAELQLGLRIPDGQTWNMASQVEANVSVNLGLDQEYTVAVYDKNPLYDSSARFYTMGKVQEGGSFNASITLPTAAKTVYIATYDSKNRSVVNTVNVENGKIVANIGGSGVAAKNRAVEDASVYPDYVKTLDNYLNPASVVVYGNNFTVANISLEGMASYTALTDAIITGDTSQGNHTLSDKNSNPTEHFPGNGDGKHYRVAADTEITEVFNINGTYGVINDAVIYIEGTVHLNGNTLNGPTLVVAPGGKIILDGNTDMSNAGRIVVMAGGSIEAAENVTPTFNVNNGAACYNAGTIDFDGQLNVNGSDTYNKGTITVDVLRNTSGGKFTNFGHITARTNMQAADSYNSTIINGCYMHFTEDAGIGTLTMLDNSRLDVDGRAEFNQGDQYLYNNSKINVGTLYVNATSFWGTDNTSDKAIIKMDKVYFADNIYINQNKNDKYQNERWTWIARKVTGKGEIYLDWDDSETYDKDGNKITLDNGYTMLSVVRGSEYNYTSEASSPIIIPEGDCTGMGNNPGGGGGKIYGDPVVYTYAFEDQTVGTDYDMNDVVLKVSYKVKSTNAETGKVEYDKTKLVATLVAAGATYNIKVKIGETYLFDGAEIHEALGVNPGVMVNTGNGKAQTATPVSDEILTEGLADEDGNIDFTQLPVSIEVLSTNTTYVYPNTDEYPHAIMVPTDWAWPTERTIITEAYPGSGTETITAEDGTVFPINSFSAWAATPAANRATVLGSVKWYETSAANGKTMTNASATNN